MSTEIIIAPDQLEKKFLEACQIIEMLRKLKKIWEQEYGSTHRENLRRWEKIADKFLVSLTTQKIEEDD